ncbi:2-amino-4-hydroxy-6-hydroxymethyldihydropteridine diphosphokinase [Rapidithrix thailandica]|uniref:2-amino-4-hydroxy-6-hydroxymethyldihydropteridine pyrophosphokinase n=1 Tax=Rapidithrix thailandica TaxID=413964 RepID=A0AAW9S874_9BACT
MHKVVLLLGGNIGDRQANLTQARLEVDRQLGKVLQTSALYETAAWGVEDQPSFLNQALVILTALPPEELLQKIHKVEAKLGRKRQERWHSRTIDIDILFYGDLQIDTPTLTVPHSELHNRKFALYPLSEIAADWMHPDFKMSVKQLLDICPDKLPVKRFDKHHGLLTVDEF